MYVYLITNKINDKKYVGITNDYKKRWANHKCNNDPSMTIAKAIQKYGVSNFKFEIIEENVPLEKINQKEIYYIEKFESHVSTGKGYNVSKGGLYNLNYLPRVGVDNGRALLTEKQVRYIKANRNIPEMILYEKFCDIISYEAFQKIYLNKTYKNIEPTSEIYPHNFEFSCQFNSGKLTYSDVVKLRKQYNKGVYWKDAYIDEYKELYKNEFCFWEIYNGYRYKLVMPEVFTEKNKHIHSSMRTSGERNPKAKLTKDEVLFMRKLFESKEKTRQEIQSMFPQVTKSTINSILKYKTWKNIK